MAAVTLLVSSLSVRVAEACGCFAPPDPSVPVVQAGERILFARENGIVTAHIQIQYAGDAAEFGWLLPLPSRPELELGTDELFTQLIAATQPRYGLARIFEGTCVAPGTPRDGGAAFQDAAPAGPGGPAVEEGSIGPYDYAVLSADSRDALLEWLARNRYFVPAGTDDAVAPYVHQGAFFLALKLRSGKSAGDLQPVVVRYASDLPMIPIVLTSVAAQPDMGIQVWMLGQGRAIPRNYAHTVLNDARIDWLNNGANYNDVVIRATREAPGRHTFVTEYAGGSALMRNRLSPPGRFASVAELAAITTPRDFLVAVRQRGYARLPFGFFGPPVYSSPLLAILGAALPMPPALAARGVAPVDFYSRPEYWLGFYREQNPDEFAGWPGGWDPAATAVELDARIAEPARRAEALFARHPYLTRLYTTLSPEHMTRDPVFSENRSLPEVSNQHTGTLTFHCGDRPLSATTPATLRTESGFVIRYPDGIGQDPRPPLPYSRRIEAVSEEGPPAPMTDNAATIAAALSTIQAIPGAGGGPQPGGDDDASSGAGCATGGGVASLLAMLLVAGLVCLVRAWRCGPSSRA